jgi:tetratricopeptide (TPR) repeat protein
VKTTRYTRKALSFALALALTAASSTAQTSGETDAGTPALYARSYELEGKREYAEALKAIHSISPKDKNTYFFFLRLAWLYNCSGKYEDAILHYDKASRVALGATEPLLGKLSAEAAAAKWEDAEKTAMAVLKSDLKNYTARSSLAYAQFMHRRYRDAQEGYEEVLKLYPSDVTMQSGLGWSLIWQGKRREAIKVFRDVLEVSPNNPAIMKSLGKDAPDGPSISANAYQRSYQAEAEGNYVEALKAMDEVAGEAKLTHTYNLRCGWLNYLNAQYEKAITGYSAALRFAPGTVQALLGRLSAETVMGKWEDVTKTADAILRVDPKNYIARSKAAYALFSLNRFQDSERIYQELAREYPGDLSAHSGVGWCQLKLDKKTEATREFKNILQFYPAHELAAKGLELLQPTKPAQ